MGFSLVYLSICVNVGSSRRHATPFEGEVRKHLKIGKFALTLYEF